MNNDALNTEWCLLQNQYDSYEKHSLYIKLASIMVLSATLLFGTLTPRMLLIFIVFWLQDAIWKTFQSRLEPRLIIIEQSIALAQPSEPISAFQFNSQYQRNALSGGKLVGEYLKQALRPTIAFPHCALIAILLANILI